MYLIENLKYIDIIYYAPVESVKLMVQEHYDKPEYDKTLFILNVYFDYFDDLDLTKYNKMIYYFLEHSVTDQYYVDYQQSDIDNFKYLYDIGVSEIWSMDYNSNYEKSVGGFYNIPVKYKPVRYTSLIPHVDNINTTPKTVDLFHIGIIGCSDHRAALLKEIECYYYYISVKLMLGTKTIRDAINEMNNCRYILDTKRMGEILTQNQVRIFELLCMGYTVCGEKCDVNIFPGLIYEWSTVDDLHQIIERNEYLNPTEAYKEMTYTDEAYEQYVNNLIQLQSNVN